MRKEALIKRLDGWANLLTNLGVIGKDKTLATEMTPDLLDQQTLENLWRGDDIAAKIVEYLVAEALRKGFVVQLAEDRSALDDQTREAERRINAALAPSGIDLVGQVKLAAEYERAYGGSAIFMGALDGRKPDQPLDESGVRAFRFLQVFEPRELRPLRWYGDPLRPDFGKPELLEVVPIAGYDTSSITSQIHESRLVMFPGIRVTKRTYRENNGWGDSVLNRVYSILQRFNNSFDGSASILAEISIPILKLKGLAEILSANDRTVVQNRAQALDLARSVARTLILDSEEDFSRSTTTVTGMSDLLDKWMERLAAAAGMPISILFGRQPGGLNSTGQTDLEVWYSSVVSYQTQELQPRIERLLRVLFRSKDGPTGGIEPDYWSIKWLPLQQLGEVADSDRRLKVAQTDQIYFSMGALTPDEIRKSRFGGDSYNPDTTIDPDIDLVSVPSEQQQPNEVAVLNAPSTT